MAGELPALGAFFLSGAAALVFEVAWFHRAGLVFGSSLWAVTIVLSAFMGGLAIGNALVARYAARIRHPLALYALLELAVGGFGIAAVYVLPTLTGIVVPTAHLLPEGSLALNATRLIAAFVVLVVPATAMGATLPVLAGAVGRARSFGGVLGRLYGFNTLGAVAGVMGTLQAIEVIKELLQLGDSLVGRLLLYDALPPRFTVLDYDWDPENPLNGENPCYGDLAHHRATPVTA